MKPTKRALMRCLDRLIAECDDQPSFRGEPLRRYCSQSNHMECLLVLEDMGHIRLGWGADDPDRPRWAVPLDGARAAAYGIGASRRAKLLSFGAGLLSGVLATFFSAWLTGALRIAG